MECKGCFFWTAYGWSDGRGTEPVIGVCNRFPPTLPTEDDTEVNHFPATHHDNWCGEFRPENRE